MVIAMQMKAVIITLSLALLLLVSCGPKPVAEPPAVAPPADVQVEPADAVVSDIESSMADIDALEVELDISSLDELEADLAELDKLALD